MEQLSAHKGQFGHVLKVERGRDKLFPSAYDGVVHLNIQLLQGATLPNFLAIREEGRTLLNVSYVFSDLHKKACFRCGQLAHLGQYSTAEWLSSRLPSKGQCGPSWMSLGGRPWRRRMASYLLPRGLWLQGESRTLYCWLERSPSSRWAWRPSRKKTGRSLGIPS